MIDIDLRDTIKETIATISAFDAKKSKALVRALNKTATNLRTEAGREIRKEYNVTLRGIRQASRIKKARNKSRFPQAVLFFLGRPINLVEFGARAVNPWNVQGRKHKKRGGGVSVQVKRAGGRKLVGGSFLATLVSGQNAGKKGVFHRVGRERYPIRFRPSLSVPQMAGTRAMAQVLTGIGVERFRVNFSHELKFELSKGR